MIKLHFNKYVYLYDSKTRCFISYRVTSIYTKLNRIEERAFTYALKKKKLYIY